jgi:hypothetical protein
MSRLSRYPRLTGSCHALLFHRIASE